MKPGWLFIVPAIIDLVKYIIDKVTDDGVGGSSRDIRDRFKHIDFGDE